MADATERSTTKGPLRPYRNHRVAQQVPVRFARMHPTFGSACGDPPGDRTPEMNENGLRTQVASRAGSVFGAFGAKNHRKSVQHRNATNFVVRSLHGHCCPWKKTDRLWRMRPGEVRPRVPSAHTETTCMHSKCQFGLRNAPNFRRRVWGPAQGPHSRDESKRTTNASRVTCGQCFRGFRCEKS